MPAIRKGPLLRGRHVASLLTTLVLIAADGAGRGGREGMTQGVTGRGRGGRRWTIEKGRQRLRAAVLGPTTTRFLGPWQASRPGAWKVIHPSSRLTIARAEEQHRYADVDLMRFDALNCTWLQSRREVELLIELGSTPSDNVYFEQINRKKFKLRVGDVFVTISDLWQNVVADGTYWSIEEREVEGTVNMERNKTVDSLGDAITDQTVANALEDAKVANQPFELMDLGEVPDIPGVADDNPTESFDARMDRMMDAKSFSELRKEDSDTDATSIKDKKETIRVLSTLFQKESPGLRWKAFQVCGDRPPDRNVTTSVFFDVATRTEGLTKSLGRVVIGLFGNAVPKAAENFRCLATGERGESKKTGRALHYLGTHFFKIIRNFAIQGGDIECDDGSGGESIFEDGKPFEDEAYDKHNEKYLVSMTNRGRSDDNRSQFFILLRPDSWLDDKHVVVGKVTMGTNVIDEIEKYGDNLGNPKKSVFISACGEYFGKQTDEIAKPGGVLDDLEERLVKIQKESVLLDLKNARETDDNTFKEIKEIPTDRDALLWNELSQLRSIAGVDDEAQEVPDEKENKGFDLEILNEKFRNVGQKQQYDENVPPSPSAPQAGETMEDSIEEVE